MTYQEAVATHGSVTAAAKALGLPRETLRDRLKRSNDLMIPGIAHTPAGIWIKTGKDENGIARSAYYSIQQSNPDFLELISKTISDATARPLQLPPKFVEQDGNLLVLDPADVHIGKLSLETETGYCYDQDVATHRLIEGCLNLARKAKLNGVSHVLFVIGNDIAHIDNPKRTTTSGTPQDTDGSIFSIFRAAQIAYIRVIEKLLEMELGVTVIFNPSNHDFVLGFTIAQTIGAWFKDHPNVSISDYNLSENPRKYVRFGSNLLGLSHGDGTKDLELGQIMMAEATGHMAACPHRYWYLHHYHHKISKSIGIRPVAREKDHQAMTVMRSGGGAQEGDRVHVEYIRSPSPPDGWHHRNGYLNRQAVEAFIHHPRDGQIMRLTEWF